MSFNINEFKAKGLKYGGARPTLFECRFAAPPQMGLSNEAQRNFSFVAQAASLPRTTVEPIVLPYFGRQVYVHGDRVYEPWAVSVQNDEDFGVRALFEKWLDNINTAISNRRVGSVTRENDYKVDMEIIQYGKNGDKIRGYSLVGAFPTTVGPIGLSWANRNTYETFEVSFVYDYWVPINEFSLPGAPPLDVFTGTLPGDFI